MVFFELGAKVLLPLGEECLAVDPSLGDVILDFALLMLFDSLLLVTLLITLVFLETFDYLLLFELVGLEREDFEAIDL